MNFPDRFGFESDLRKCVGKSIKRVEWVAMEPGCVWPNAFAVQFTDGSRAFFAGQPGTGIMNPKIDGKVYGERETVETSEIFTKQELAVMIEARNAQARSRAKDEEREARRRYNELHRRFGTVLPLEE